MASLDTLSSMSIDEIPAPLREYLEKTGVLHGKPWSELSVRERYDILKARRDQQHPLYTTASSEIGAVPEGVPHEVVPPAHAKRKLPADLGFGGRRAGLDTAPHKHRYMKHLDGEI